MERFLIDFVIGLPISSDRKGEIYNSILIIIDKLIKIVYYEPVIVIIDILGLTKVIINVVVWYRGLFNSIVSNCGSVFISKF